MNIFQRILDWLWPPPPPPPPPPDPDLPAPDPIITSARLLTLHNQQRVAAELAPLRLVQKLECAADRETALVCKTGQFSHTPGGSQLTDRFTACGYVDWLKAGENIAGDFPTPEAAMNAWMQSPGHRANILGPYTDVGFSCRTCKTGKVWAATFGSPGRLGTRAIAPDVQLSGPLHPEPF